MRASLSRLSSSRIETKYETALSKKKANALGRLKQKLFTEKHKTDKDLK